MTIRENSDLTALDNESRITLELLTALDGNDAVTQRTLANELGVALGLANSYLKRCLKKGLIKVKQVPANRYSYYLTPKGFSEKSRLTAEYLRQSFNFFRVARQQTTEILAVCQSSGWERIALAGKSELTEVAILSAAEQDITLAGIVDAEAHKTTSSFMSIPVVATAADLGALQAVIITDMAGAQQVFDEAVKFFPRERVLTPDILGVQRDPRGNGGRSARRK